MIEKLNDLELENVSAGMMEIGFSGKQMLLLIGVPALVTFTAGGIFGSAVTGLIARRRTKKLKAKVQKLKERE